MVKRTAKSMREEIDLRLKKLFSISLLLLQREVHMKGEK
jgi:hypothetical protein